MEKKEVFFVGVNSGPELRRDILETMKNCIENLQSYERLKSLKDEKVHVIAKLRSNLKQISGLIRDVKSELPKTGLRSLPKKPVEEVEVKEVKEPKVVAPKATELDKLTADLNDIESKLSSLA